MEFNSFGEAMEAVRSGMEFAVSRKLPWQAKRSEVGAWMEENAGAEWGEFMSWFGAEVDSDDDAQAT